MFNNTTAITDLVNNTSTSINMCTNNIAATDKNLAKQYTQISTNRVAALALSAIVVCPWRAHDPVNRFMGAHIVRVATARLTRAAVNGKHPNGRIRNIRKHTHMSGTTTDMVCMYLVSGWVAQHT